MRHTLVLVACLLSGTVHAAPPPVLGDAVIPNPASFIDETAAYLEGVRPGSSAQFQGMKRFMEQSGVDLTRPMWVLILDPNQASSSIVGILNVKDAAAFTAALGRTGMGYRPLGKLFVVAPKPLLDTVPDAMLTALVSRPLPPIVRVRLDAPRVHAAISAPGAPFEETSLPRALKGLLTQAKEIVVELRVSSRNIEMTASLTGPPGSLVARLGKAARPGDFRLAGTLASSPLLIAAHFDPAMVAELVRASLSAQELAELQEGKDLFALATGEVAFGLREQSGIPLVILAGVKDPKSVPNALTKTWAAAKMKPVPFREGDIPADEVTTPTKMTVITSVLERDLAFVVARTSPEARTSFREILGSRAASLPAVFTEAKARKDSLVARVDVSPFFAAKGKTAPTGIPPAVVSAGAVPGGLRVRCVVPAATAAALISLRD